MNILIFNCCISLLSNCNYDFLNWRLDLYANESSNLLKLKTKIILNWVVSFTITILNYYYYFILFVPVATFAFLLVRKVLPVVSLENWDLGSGPWFLVVDPGVHYRGPLLPPAISRQTFKDLINVCQHWRSRPVLFLRAYNHHGGQTAVDCPQRPLPLGAQQCR